MYVSTISILVNLSLTLIKFTAGFTAKSEAMISDAVHTASDVFSTIIVIIGVVEWMYWFTRAAAKKINSGALMADAWHHRSGALSSVGDFAGIMGARLGFECVKNAFCVHPGNSIF